MVIKLATLNHPEELVRYLQAMLKYQTWDSALIWETYTVIITYIEAMISYPWEIYVRCIVGMMSISKIVTVLSRTFYRARSSNTCIFIIINPIQTSSTPSWSPAVWNTWGSFGFSQTKGHWRDAVGRRNGPAEAPRLRRRDEEKPRLQIRRSCGRPGCNVWGKAKLDQPAPKNY